MRVDASGLVGTEQIARAHSALILYTVKTSPYNEDAFATRHEIEQNDQGAYLGPGTIVTAPLVQKLLNELHQAPLTFVPEATVAIGQDSFAWFVPASTRRMYFVPRDGQDQALATFDRKEIPQPPLLFIARRGKNLSVFALRENTRPNASTELMWAPYWNVFNSHQVCIGTMKLPKSLTPNDSGLWTDAFFRSNFSTAETGFYHAFKGTYAEMLAAAIPRNSFDTAWLKPAGVTVEKALCISY